MTSKKVGMVVVKLGDTKQGIVPTKKDLENFKKMLYRALKGTEWGKNYDSIVYNDLFSIEIFKY